MILNGFIQQQKGVYIQYIETPIQWMDERMDGWTGAPAYNTIWRMENGFCWKSATVIVWAVFTIYKTEFSFIISHQARSVYTCVPYSYYETIWISLGTMGNVHFESFICGSRDTKMFIRLSRIGKQVLYLSFCVCRTIKYDTVACNQFHNFLCGNFELSELNSEGKNQMVDECWEAMKWSYNVFQLFDLKSDRLFCMHLRP